MRTVKQWNKLPGEVVGSPSLEDFRSGLDRQWAGVILP